MLASRCHVWPANAGGFAFRAALGRSTVHVHHSTQVDMDKLETEGREAFEGADSVFCCLGTTRPVGAATPREQPPPAVQISRAC